MTKMRVVGKSKPYSNKRDILINLSKTTGCLDIKNNFQ